MGKNNRERRRKEDRSRGQGTEVDGEERGRGEERRAQARQDSQKILRLNCVMEPLSMISHSAF